MRRARGIRPWNLPEYCGALLVAVAFGLSRVFYCSRGIRLDCSTIEYFDQLLDPLLLRGRLAESLLYLHGQPPLYNVLTAIALKLVPAKPQLVLAPVFVVCGLYTGLCLFVIQARLRVPVLIAALVASAIVALPPFVLYENWYFYPHLNVAWLLGALAWLAQSRGCPGREMTISAAHLAGLSLTRSLFHPFFFGLAVAVVVALVAPGARRRCMACFLIPTILVVAWCAKNQILFGFFGTSSWSSRNLSHAVETLVGSGRVQSEARLGRLSPAAGRDPFEPGDSNVAVFGLKPRTTGIPALDNVHKQNASFHSVSYNHWSYPASAPLYAQNARDLILTYPVTYLRGLFTMSLPIFFHPVDEGGFFQPNRQTIARAAQRFDDFDVSELTHWFLGIGLLFSALASVSWATPRSERIVLALAFLTLAWVVFVGVVGELGENYRFRYKILWLAWALASAGYAVAIRRIARAVEGLVRSTSTRRQSAGGATTTSSSLLGS
jgi:hypothetical protein